MTLRMREHNVFDTSPSRLEIKDKISVSQVTYHRTGKIIEGMYQYQKSGRKLWYITHKIVKSCPLLW